MYLLKNSSRNLYRNFARNFLLIVIIFMIVTAMGASIMISSATEGIIKQYKEQFDSEVFIIHNPESRNAEKDNLTAKQLLSFSKSDLLKKSHVVARLSATLKDFSPINKTDTTQKDLLQPNISLIGSSREDISDEFQMGIRKVVTGRNIEGEAEILISKPLAEKNNLKVGDTISIFLFETEDVKNTVEFKIVGIYEDNSKDDLALNSPIFRRSNEIFTDFNYLTSLKEYESEFSMTLAIYSLKDPSNLKNLEREFREKGLSEDFALTIDDSSYKKVIQPVEELTKMLHQFTSIIFLFSSATILILSAIVVKERKNEIGILRAMGMKRGKLFLGLLMENIMITIICLILGLSIVNITSKPLGNLLLEMQPKVTDTFEYSNEGDQIIITNDFGSVLKTNEHIKNIEINLDKQMIVKITVLSILLAILSCTVNAIFIMRYEPAKILKGRN